MKRVLINVSMVALMVGLMSCEKETVLPETSVPSKVKTYLTTHFPTHTVVQYVKDVDGLELTYDINLSDGLFLEFNRKEEIIEIDGVNQLPNSVIPSKILDYVATHYPENFITDWELDDRNQQIKLNNNLELEFTMSGDFLRIDN